MDGRKNTLAGQIWVYCSRWNKKKKSAKDTSPCKSPSTIPAENERHRLSRHVQQLFPHMDVHTLVGNATFFL